MNTKKSHQTKRNTGVRRHMRRPKILTIAFITLFITIILSHLYTQAKNPIYDAPEVVDVSGENKSYSEKNLNNHISVLYPTFNCKKIDKIILNKVNEYVEAFKEKNTEYVELTDTTKADLKIGYESYKATDDVMSVLLKISEREAFEETYKSEYYALAFDPKNDIKISLDDLFKGRYLNYISSYVEDYLNNLDDEIDYERMRQALYPSSDNFSAFTLDSDKITFYFDKSKFTDKEVNDHYIVEIPYYDMYGFFRRGYLDSKVEQDDYVYDQVFGLVDERVPSIAITFDDGPGKYTQEIVDILREYNAVATFFMLGERIDMVEPEVLDNLLNEGSTINSHSYSHKDFKRLSAESIKNDVTSTRDKIYDVTGGYEIRFFRPPYGSYNDTVKENVPYPLVMWSVDTRDWATDDPDVVYENSINNIQDGDVILLHEVHESTVVALPRILETLKEQGFQFVTIEEMYDIKNSKLQRGVIIENN